MATVRLHTMFTFSPIGVCVADIDMATYKERLIDGYGMASWDN